MLSTGVLKEPFLGYYNLFDQFIDIGIIVPIAIFVGVLLLKRNAYGFLFSTVPLILVLNIGLSVVKGQSSFELFCSSIYSIYLKPFRFE